MRSKLSWLPYIVIAALIATVLLRSHQLTDVREELKVEQDFRHEISETLGSPADDRTSVAAAARAIIQTRNNQRATLEQVNRESREHQRRAIAADAELQRVQAENRRDFSAAQPKIRELEQREPTGNPKQDEKLIDEDSQAPWRGWK
jgi:E3 ubiquitin-protein ligase DOA10